MPHGTRFALLLGLTLVFRFWLGSALPISGDEAYFIWWGWQPDWGFYDHPPMIGWWLAALASLSNADAWLRLPSIVQPALLSLAIWWALPRLWPDIDDTRRYGIATLVLLAPANIWNVLITTDTPLVYFSVLSALAWLRAAQEREGDGLRWYLVSGVFLAGAVLSKYFIALLGFAYLIDVLRRRTPWAFAGLIVAYACCVPALVLMGWWNSANCWSNYMFNFVNRHGKAGASLTTPLLYAVSLLYLLTPPALWFVLKNYRNRRVASADLRNDGLADGRTTATLFTVPLLLFALLSVPKTIGLHWLLTFVPLFLIWLGMRVTATQMLTLIRFFAGLALLHVLAIVAIAQLPLETWKKQGFYGSAVLTVAHQEFADFIVKERQSSAQPWVLAMDGYSNAVTLGYNLREHVLVFGNGSSHARHDDIQTDFRALAGRNILILSKDAPKTDEYTPFFTIVSVEPFVIRGATFWRVRGEGFQYEAYRDRVLRRIKEKYYRLPHWLPQRACYLCDRYFPGEVCLK
ncbi:MAG: glycosyltransferase family 39 protein [Rhodocyclaceae bacterium]|nr:glycosyltransferase family 39 protein [Rhodocyclaceae bacterium]